MADKFTEIQIAQIKEAFDFFDRGKIFPNKTDNRLGNIFKINLYDYDKVVSIRTLYKFNKIL